MGNTFLWSQGDVIFIFWTGGSFCAGKVFLLESPFKIQWINNEISMKASPTKSKWFSAKCIGLNNLRPTCYVTGRDWLVTATRMPGMAIPFFHQMLYFVVKICFYAQQRVISSHVWYNNSTSGTFYSEKVYKKFENTQWKCCLYGNVNKSYTIFFF